MIEEGILGSPFEMGLRFIHLTTRINRPRQEYASMPLDVNAARLHRFVRGLRSAAVVAPLDDRRPVGGASSYRAAAAVASIFFASRVRESDPGQPSPGRLGSARGVARFFRSRRLCPEGQRREAFSDAEKGMRADRSRIRENSECSKIIRILTNSVTKMLHGVA
jgi:hypothetical protein